MRLSPFAALIVTALAAGCHPAQSPELRVIGVNDQPRREIVFVQVTNPASRTMRLTHLAYTFAAEGTKLSEGEFSLAREVPAGAAVVVEIPLDTRSEKPMTLSGRLTTELDHIVETFSISATVKPAK
jgi:LEA14-like dessication related protein